MKRSNLISIVLIAVVSLVPVSYGNAEDNKSNNQNKVEAQKGQRQENFIDSGVRSFGFPVANWTDTSLANGKSDRPSVNKDQADADKEFLSYITSQVKLAKAAAVGSNASNPISCHGSCTVYTNQVAIVPVWAGTGWTQTKLDNWNRVLSNLVTSLSTTGPTPVSLPIGSMTHILSTNKDYFKVAGTAPSFIWVKNTSITPIPGNSTSVSDENVATVINNYISSANASLIPTGFKPIYVYIGAGNTRLSSGFGTRYCGWHTFGTLTNSSSNIPYIAIQDFASTYLPNCAKQTISPNGDAQLDAMASVLVHEIDESITDPFLNAWYDSRGAENADKCAWTFGATQTTAGASYNVTYNSIKYLIQQNWLATNKVTASGASNASACTVSI